MASADLPNDVPTHIPNDHARPTDEAGRPVERRKDPPPNASAMHTMLATAASEAGEKVAGAMGLKGWFLQLANLTAVAVGLIVNVMLVMFLMNEIKAARSDAAERSDRDRIYYSSQLDTQREHDTIRTQLVAESIKSMISETRAATAETRAARQSFERVEKWLEKAIPAIPTPKKPAAPPDEEPQVSTAPAPRPKS